MKIAPIAAALSLALPCGLALRVDAQDQGFTPLFNGKDMTGLKLAGAPESTWKVQDGVIICSGRPAGYFYTEKSYRNYVLRFDWRYQRPEGLQDDAQFGGNSGLLVHITGEHKVWPTCIEVQLMNRDAGNIFPLGGKFRRTRLERQREAIKPVGQWNSEEVTCEEGKIACKINGILVAEGEGADPSQGPIGWQSEGAEIHFRNLRIRELK